MSSRLAIQCLAAALAAVLAIGLMACGDEMPSASEPAILRGTEGRPDVPIPQGPPPERLVIKEIEKGSGRPAQVGDEMFVRYFRFEYGTNRILEDQWRKPLPPFTLGAGQMSPAWEKGLPGARAGSRRELIMPKAGAFVSVPQVHVIDVVSVTPPKASR
jgi:peptidylprolyl isomerase